MWVLQQHVDASRSLTVCINTRQKDLGFLFLSLYIYIYIYNIPTIGQRQFLYECKKQKQETFQNTNQIPFLKLLLEYSKYL